MKEKGSAHIFLLLFLLIGLIIGIFLVTSKTPFNFIPKAGNEFSLAGFRAAYGSRQGDVKYDPQYDANNDGKINSQDYAKLMTRFLVRQTPSPTSSATISATPNAALMSNISTLSAINCDINKDNQINFSDTEYWAACIRGDIEKCKKLDFNLDYYVNATDLSAFNYACPSITYARNNENSFPTIPLPTPSPGSLIEEPAEAVFRGSNRLANPINVLVLSYFPLDSSGTKLDPAIAGTNESLEGLKRKIANNNQQRISALWKASKYHGYKDASKQATFLPVIIDNKEFKKALPISNNEIPWNSGIYRPDYKALLTTDVNICDYVDNKNVKQIWLWGYHYGKIEPVESDMSMGFTSKAFWNFPNYGDVSNSEQIDDLPVCNKTYVLYNYNFTRTEGDTLENHTHHIEALMRFVNEDLWNKFVNPHGEGGQTVNRCGWTHSPPNVTDANQYLWNSKTSVKSDCEDWRPEGGGEVKDVNCHTWYGPNACPDNYSGGEKFKIWWMQNIPGDGNNLTYQGKALRNWLEFYSDFDAAVAKGKSLTVN
ncbi:hypothetical protein HYU94_00825 [Candidatus Daviesbacteria bacterium]|nr:hypothetical protein [Candidatus Daviesbacteria bacterium]